MKTTLHILIIVFVLLCPETTFSQTTSEALRISAQSTGRYYHATLSYSWGNAQVKDRAGVRNIGLDTTKLYRSDSAGICFRSVPFTIGPDAFITFDSRLHFTLSTELPERYIGEPIPTIIVVDLIDASTGKELDRIEGIQIRSAYGDQVDTVAAGHQSMDCREMTEQGSGMAERSVYLQATIITNEDAFPGCKGTPLPAGTDVLKSDLQ